MQSVPLKRDIREKTLEAWVTLANLTQRGCGVIGLDTPQGRFFDSIVFGEKKPGHWMAGSDFFLRTEAPGGPRETAGPKQLIHVAIVYAKDNSITVYRNGIRYGKSYKRGKVHTFVKGGSRFLFGQRLTGVNPPLAGEVEEARAYYRGLSAEEVAASFKAGPQGISDEQIAAVLSPKVRKQWSKLRSELKVVRKDLERLPFTATGRLAKALQDARKDTANPLFLWHEYNHDEQTRSSASSRRHWKAMIARWKTELKKRRTVNESFTQLWNLRKDHQKWFQYGSVNDGLVGGYAGRPNVSSNGEFSILPNGDHVIRRIYPAGIYSHRLSQRHTGMLVSPRFVIKTDRVSVRVAGRNSWVRLVIENNARGNGGIFPATRLNQEDVRWIQFNTAYRKGSRAYFEFITFEGNFGDPSQRGFFGVAEMVASNRNGSPNMLTAPIVGMLNGSAPTSSDELAQRYTSELQRVARAWGSNKLSDRDTDLLNFFLSRELLPTRISRLPVKVRKLIEQYRRLESSIPVPRRSPGLIDAGGFDQPLFIRGNHKRPGTAVRRRGLSLLSKTPFNTKSSGRLQLAEQTASAHNPLTARVMVNRLWHHLFGRGLVATVDNFGRLGEKPSHPELLDYLAHRFMHDEKWSMKRMIRLMITSRTWQQSSVASAAAKKMDIENRWLSHMSIRRLDADAIRDAILASSGQLKRNMYGVSVSVYFVKKTENGGRRKGPLDGNGRRSVYLQIRRNAHNPFLEVFDAPKPTTTRGRRDITNVPAQSLTMLNDPFVIDQAKKWAMAIVNDKRTSQQRVRNMFQVALGRQPDANELAVSTAYLRELATEHPDKDNIGSNTKVWQDFAQSMFCLKEFIYVR